jgi:predicted nucleic acid-binding Zn ribbon protein
MSAPLNVTVSVSRTCEGCGASLEGRRRQTRTCSDRCRQSISRKRRTRRNGLEELHAAGLTHEQRVWLKREVVRLRLEQAERQRERDRLLFADEWAAA